MKPVYYQTHPDIDQTAYTDAWKNITKPHVQCSWGWTRRCSKHVEDTI